jgi:RND superfamily putative drug exporter
MRLLGRWNWWAPAPVMRWWELHGVRESARPVLADDLELEPVG